MLAAWACALALLCAGLHAPALADTQRPKDLRTLGEHPFTGTKEVACELHAKAHGLVGYEECLKTLRASDDPKVCPSRPLLQDGTEWWMTFTRDGKNHIGRYRIAFGKKVSKDDPMRFANDCSQVPGLSAFVKPLTCGNYALPTVLPPLVVTPPRQTSRLVCQPRPFGSQAQPSESLYLPGFSVQSCCCGSSTSVPGIVLSTPGSSLQSQGYTMHCEFVPDNQ